jgi:hypothetical protein
MKRRLFNIAAVVSVLLWLAAVAAWVDSYWHFSAVGVAARDLGGSVTFYRGNMTLTVERNLDHGGLFGNERVRPAMVAIHDPEYRSEYELEREWDGFDDRVGGGHNIMLIGPTKIWHGFGASSEDGFDTGLRALAPGEKLTPDYHVWNLGMPAWFLVVMTFIVPAVWMIDRRRCRVLENHCEKCGYDLRATPDRCPECGTVSGGAE